MMRLVVSVALGLVVSVALSFALFPFRAPPPDAPWVFWYEGVDSFGRALQSVAPGFVTGWFAARYGLLLGAIVAVLVAIGTMLFVSFWWGLYSPTVAAITLVFGGMGGVITQSVAGAAGESLRRRWAP